MLKAQLICIRSKLDERDGIWQWENKLINIRAVSVNSDINLLGKTFHNSDSLLLENIIPVHKREDHNMRFNRILNEGSRSICWKIFMAGLKSEPLKIINPVDDTPRFVNLVLNQIEESTKDGLYTFNIIVRYIITYY